MIYYFWTLCMKNLKFYGFVFFLIQWFWVFYSLCFHKIKVSMILHIDYWFGTWCRPLLLVKKRIVQSTINNTSVHQNLHRHPKLWGSHSTSQHRQEVQRAALKKLNSITTQQYQSKFLLKQTTEYLWSTVSQILKSLNFYSNQYWYDKHSYLN